MIPRLSPMRSQRDDSAPNDWSYVRSVEQERRRRQSEQTEQRRTPNVRHRADPFQHMKPVLGEITPVSQSVIPDDPFDLEAVQAPFEPPKPEQPVRQEQQPNPAAPRRRAARIVTQDGSQFDSPGQAQMPEWMRIAQQNTMPSSESRPVAPVVRAAPAPMQEDVSDRRDFAPVRQADRYAAAGYPPELLAAQQRIDAQQEAIAQRKRHGAQAAVPMSRTQPLAEHANQALHPNSYLNRRPLTEEERAARLAAVQQHAGHGAAYAATTQAPSRPQRQNPYAVQQPQQGPSAVRQWNNPYARPLESVPSVDQEEVQSRFSIPWLGILTTLVLLAAIGLWIAKTNLHKQIDQVFLDRHQAQTAIADGHPYRYRELIEQQADRNNLHPAFVAAIVFNESSFRPEVESNVGARGLMQVMSDTAEYVNDDLNIPNYSFDRLYEPEINLQFGCYYLGELSRRFWGDPVLVAAAYHAGPTTVQNWLNNSQYSNDRRTLILDNLMEGPTKQYATRVLRDFSIYKRLYYEIPEAGL
ncbi:MAG: hypothetical protein E7319_07395 [Clostridiales bacterium]|nr:hypothetical protein [Clostridiales bacterium]